MNTERLAGAIGMRVDLVPLEPAAPEKDGRS